MQESNQEVIDENMEMEEKKQATKELVTKIYKGYMEKA